MGPTAEPNPIVRRPTKTPVLVAHALAQRVAGLEPGAMLPSEQKLVAELGVGRGTLREALRLLELQGVITVKTGARGGPVACRPDHRPLADTLSVFLQASDAPYSQVAEARRSIEAELARLAAEHASDEEIDALQRSIEAMAEQIADHDFFLEENLRFHQIIAAAARNEVLQVFHTSLKAISDGHAVGIAYSVRRRSAVLAMHERIAAAIASRDPEASYQAMSDHMGDFQTYIKRRYPEVLKRPVRWLLQGG